MVDLKPPKPVRDNARLGLKMRKEAPKSLKGGLTTREAGKLGIGSGVARAATLVSGREVSKDTVRKMVSFFARHRKHKDTPKGKIAWLLWGGDSGKKWAQEVWKQIKKEEDNMKEEARLHKILSSMPTRKSFRQKANEISQIEDEGQRELEAEKHANLFKAKNPRFNPDLFHRASRSGRGWFESMSQKDKRDYLNKHPNSKYKTAASWEKESGEKVEINPENKGKWTDWTIKELMSKLRELKNKEDRTEEDTSKIRQILFAIRAKKRKKWGKVFSSFDSVASVRLFGQVVLSKENAFIDYRGNRAFYDNELVATIEAVPVDEKYPIHVIIKDEHFLCEDMFCADALIASRVKPYVQGLRRSEGMSVEDIAKKHDVPVGVIVTQLSIGTVIEAEHGGDEENARGIAMDHITESPSYYTLLLGMERSFEG